MAEEKALGIYSTEQPGAIGVGMTRRKGTQKRYWHVWEGEDGFIVQPLNQNLVPTGDRRPVQAGEFRERFTHEPDFYVDPQSRRARRLWDRGEEVQEKVVDETLDMDDPLESLEREARAEFGMAVVQLKRGNRSKAESMFRELADLKGDFERRHKHMFNDFGINLRKSRLPNIALKHYERALELSPDDDHLLHNMARAYYEQGEVDRAISLLERSLELNPGLEVSAKFLKFIKKKRQKEKVIKVGF